MRSLLTSPHPDVDEAKRRVREELAVNPGAELTPHDLVGRGLATEDKSEDGYALRFAVDALDDLLAEGVLRECGLHTYTAA